MKVQASTIVVKLAPGNAALGTSLVQAAFFRSTNHYLQWFLIEQDTLKEQT
jgi:hypothetical protein